MKTLAGLFVVAVGFACGGSGGKEPPAAKIDVAAVNALVPDALKATILFEERSIEEERGRNSKTVYTMAAPRSWTPGDMKMFAKLKPPSSDNFGTFTELSLGNNCDGACAAKDWAEVSERVDFKQFRDKKIAKDELTKTSHLMVAEDGDDTFITYAWWADGADRYFTCRATLSKGFSTEGPDPRSAAPAFEKACQTVNVKRD